MTRVLVQDNFRYESGQVSSGEDITVVLRGTSTLVTLYVASAGPTQLSNPMIADDSGNVAFYVDPGSYDFLSNGGRVPFDAITPSGSDFYAQHDQSSALATWTIPHAFGRYPDVTLIDSANKLILTDLEYPDLATVVATFATPTTGKAILQA